MSTSPAAPASATATATATSTSTTNSTVLRPQTYWCYECDMSVIILQPYYTINSATFPPICPHCRHDFLEQMDSFTPNISRPPPHPSPNPTSFFEPFSPMDPANPSDDTFLLGSPYLHRLIHQLITTGNNNIPNQNNVIPPQYDSPASKQAIESLNHVIVDSAFLDLDPSITCPICKDQFVVSTEAKMLPCKHAYHSDCIIPWLEMKNSCPVCRYRLPCESDDMNENEGEGESFVGAARLDELLDDDQDLFGFSSTLRNVARRQQYNYRNDDHVEVNSDWENWNRRVQWDNEVLLSPTQIGEVEGVGVGGGVRNHVERANSVETVSSWPSWPVEGGASGSGSGDGEIGVSGGEEAMKRDALRP